MTDFHALIDSYQNCACGQAHTCAIRDIEIGSGLVSEVGEILKKNGFGPRLLLAADEQTLAAADGIEASLSGFTIVRHIWPSIRVATMQDVKKIESYFDRVDGVLAVGTGSVHDPCRLACARHDVPLCLFATAPSMDGFASYSAPIVNGNFKITSHKSCLSHLFNSNTREYLCLVYFLCKRLNFFFGELFEKSSYHFMLLV